MVPTNHPGPWTNYHFPNLDLKVTILEQKMGDPGATIHGWEPLFSMLIVGGQLEWSHGRHDSESVRTLGNRLTGSQVTKSVTYAMLRP